MQVDNAVKRLYCISKIKASDSASGHHQRLPNGIFVVNFTRNSGNVRKMADRRRVNGPGGVTVPPIYEAEDLEPQLRERPANGIRAQCKRIQPQIHTTTLIYTKISRLV